MLIQSTFGIVDCLGDSVEIGCDSRQRTCSLLTLEIVNPDRTYCSKAL